MRVALLIGERLVRDAIRRRLPACVRQTDEFGTAALALDRLLDTRYDLVVMNATIYPGFGAADEEIEYLAQALPNAVHTQTILYWQVGLRVLVRLRAEDSPNRTTPVLLRFPPLGQDPFASGDVLTLDAVEADLRDKEPVCPLFDVTLDDLCEKVRLAVLRRQNEPGEHAASE